MLPERFARLAVTVSCLYLHLQTKTCWICTLKTTTTTTNNINNSNSNNSNNYNYSTLNKITQFWLVESSAINPKLYSVGVPIKFSWKRRVRKKMADSGFAILMALFLTNKELFTNFVMFNLAWKHEEDRWNYFHTKPNLWVVTILAWCRWLCYHVNWKIISFSYSS